MEFDNVFEVPLPPDAAWKVLMDIRRVAPCLPGAELTEVVDAQTYKGKCSVRLGPVALTFDGTAKFEAIDDAQHQARVKAQGRDAKGRGGASATVDFRLEPVPQGAKVMVHTDLTLSGAVAQYGRGVGMIQAVATELIGQFATSLRAELAAAPLPAAEPDVASAPSPLPPPAKPISGLALMAKVFWNWLRGLFGRPHAS